MPQTLFEGLENRAFVPRLDIDDPCCRKADLGDGWGEEVLPGHAPEHLAFGPRDNTGCKERRSRAIDRPVAAPSHLMKRPQSQTSSRKMAIDDIDAKGQDGPLGGGAALEAFNPVAKICDGGIVDGLAHGVFVPVRMKRNWIAIVPYLFLYPSQSQLKAERPDAICAKAWRRTASTPAPDPMLKARLLVLGNPPIAIDTNIGRAGKGDIWLGAISQSGGAVGENSDVVGGASLELI